MQSHAIALPSPRMRTQQCRQEFIDYVMSPEFPCVGARSAINRDRLDFHTFGELGSGDSTAPLCEAIYAFLAQYPAPGTDPVTFVAAFEQSSTSERDFGDRLWRELQFLHELDSQRHAWDPGVSDDPASNDFSFSVGGRALFVVGLTPHASRMSRRAPTDTLVFNLHSQFVALRSSGKYGGLQNAIRRRDLALQGSLNPVLAGFGEASEAMQYSGRAVGSDWQCPFRPQED